LYLDFLQFSVSLLPSFPLNLYDNLLRESITKMLIDKKTREELNHLFYLIKLQDRFSKSSLDKQVKIEQILAYLEIIHAEVRAKSRKRKLVFVDSGAGNCYLSFLVYFFYHKIENRDLEIHCIDHNEKLMKANEKLAADMNFQGIHFHAMDISDFSLKEKIDLVYSLHACDTATDKTMYLGVKNKVRTILSVSCCQHTLTLKPRSFKALARYKSFKDKMLMMVADTLRGMLLESENYKVDIFDFVSSRYTEKNTMVRANLVGYKQQQNAFEEYLKLSDEFKMRPYLEDLLAQSN